MLPTALKLIKLTHAHPMFPMGIAIVLAIFISSSFNYFASASEMDEAIGVVIVDIETNKKRINSVEEGITRIEFNMKRNHLEQQVRSLESDVMKWQSSINEESSEEHRAWLRKLIVDLNTAKRKLNRLDRVGIGVVDT
jgi:hypothetical protein